MKVNSKVLTLLKYELLDDLRIKRLFQKEARIISSIMVIFFGIGFISLGASLYETNQIGFSSTLENADVSFLVLNGAFINVILLCIAFGVFSGGLAIINEKNKEYLKTFPISKKDFYALNNYKRIAFPTGIYVLASFGILITQIIYGNYLLQHFIEWLLLFIAGFFIYSSYAFLVIHIITYIATKFKRFLRAYVIIFLLSSSLFYASGYILNFLGLSDLSTLFLQVIFFPISLGAFVYNNWILVLLAELLGIILSYIVYKLIVTISYKTYLKSLALAGKPIGGKNNKNYSFKKRTILDSLIIKEIKASQLNYISSIVSSFLFVGGVIIACAVTNPIYFGVPMFLINFLVIAVSVIILAINTSTASLPIVEIQQMWIVKTWPLTFRKIVEPKLVLSFIMLLFEGGVLLLGLYLTKYISFELFSVLLILNMVLSYFDSLFGLIINLRTPTTISAGFMMLIISLIEAVFIGIIMISFPSYWIGLIIISVILIGCSIYLEHEIDTKETYKAFINKICN